MAWRLQDHKQSLSWLISVEELLKKLWVFRHEAQEDNNRKYLVSMVFEAAKSKGQGMVFGALHLMMNPRISGTRLFLSCVSSLGKSSDF